MWLQSMWLQFDVVRGPLGVVLGAQARLWVELESTVFDCMRGKLGHCRAAMASRRAVERADWEFASRWGDVVPGWTRVPGLPTTVFSCWSGPENGHDAALELVSGTYFGCTLHHFPSPAR